MHFLLHTELTRLRPSTDTVYSLLGCSDRSFKSLHHQRRLHNNTLRRKAFQCVPKYNCAFGTFYTLTIQALCHILRLICKRYLTGLPPLLHLLDSLSMFEKLISCINPLSGHRTQHQRVLFNGTPLNVATVFKYLGSTIANDCSLNKKLSARIQSASAAFGRLHERLWNKHNINLVTKCKVYHATILSGLLYSSETYTLYRRHIQRLSQIHLRHLRAILGIIWSDWVTSNEVLQRADMPSIEAILLSRQLTWTGHVVWMNDNQLPKAVLYGELWQAKRNVGRPHLCYIDCTKRHLHAADIIDRHWEEIAHDHSAWRTAVKNGAAKAETRRATDAKIKQQHCHERALTLANRTNQQPEIACQYYGRKLTARIGQLSNERACARKR